MGDIWDQRTRGKAVALFTLAPFAGPALGPVVGGFIGVSPSASWRWLFWVLTIFAGVCLVFITFTLPETYGPVILKHKAQRLRKETGDERWYAPIEKQMQETSIGTRIKDVLTKPVKICEFPLVIQFVWNERWTDFSSCSVLRAHVDGYHSIYEREFYSFSTTSAQSFQSTDLIFLCH